MSQNPKTDWTDPVAGYIAAEALIVPQPWDEGGRVRNWRNHVGDHVKAAWYTLTDVQKVAIAWDADEQSRCVIWE